MSVWAFMEMFLKNMILCLQEISFCLLRASRISCIKSVSLWGFRLKQITGDILLPSLANKWRRMSGKLFDMLILLLLYIREIDCRIGCSKCIDITSKNCICTSNVSISIRRTLFLNESLLLPRILYPLVSVTMLLAKNLSLIVSISVHAVA
jgi:hypothetical protein